MASGGYGMDVTQAEIRRRVAGEASTVRGHIGMAHAHDIMAERCYANGWTGWANYHERMADAHAAIAQSLQALRERKVPNPRKRVVRRRKRK